MLRNYLSVFGKNDCHRSCYYLQTHIFFEPFIIFLEPTIKLITLQEYLICKRNNNFYQDSTGVFLRCLFWKRSAPWHRWGLKDEFQLFQTYEAFTVNGRKYTHANTHTHTHRRSCPLAFFRIAVEEPVVRKCYSK